MIEKRRKQMREKASSKNDNIINRVKRFSAMSFEHPVTGKECEATPKQMIKLLERVSKWKSPRKIIVK